MSVWHSPPRGGKQSATKPVTKTMAFLTVGAPEIARANITQNKHNEKETVLSVNSPALSQSAENANHHAKPFNGGLTASVSTNGMPTATTTNSSSTTTSILYTSTTTTTTSSKPLLAILPPPNVQPHISREQMNTPQPLTKRSRNSPTKSTTSSATNKKQKTATSLSQSKLPNYWLSGDTSNSTNKFASLTIEDENENETNSSANSGQNTITNAQNLNNEKNKNINNKPPPIYVQGVECINTLKNALSALANSNYVLKILGNNEVRVQANDLETYNKIYQMLKQKGSKLHTFKPKNERGFKVVLRNMHPSVDQEEIKSELREKGHKVINIYNITQRITKKPLPLFLIELETNTNNKDIYTIDKLMHCIVSFEAPHHKRLIAQCMKCQKYGHTKNYCTRDSVCVKCAGKHLTSECNNPAIQVKCALCGGNHTANYKGCEVYKAIKIQRFPPLRKKEFATDQNTNIEKSTVIPGISYADVAAPSNNVAAPSNQQVTGPELTNNSQHNKYIDELKDMVNTLITQMTNMMNIITMLMNSLNGRK